MSLKWHTKSAKLFNGCRSHVKPRTCGTTRNRNKDVPPAFPKNRSSWSCLGSASSCVFQTFSPSNRPCRRTGDGPHSAAAARWHPRREHPARAFRVRADADRADGRRHDRSALDRCIGRGALRAVDVVRRCHCSDDTAVSGGLAGVARTGIKRGRRLVHPKCVNPAHLTGGTP